MTHYSMTALILLISWGISVLGAVIEIKTMDDYKALCSQNKPFVLMFYAPWCGACNGMKEPFDQVSAELNDVILAKASVENAELKSLKEALCITSIPTFVTRQSGMMSKEALTTMTKGHIRQPLPQKAAPKSAPAQPEPKKTTT